MVRVDRAVTARHSRTAALYLYNTESKKACMVQEFLDDNSTALLNFLKILFAGQEIAPVRRYVPYVAQLW
jgi:hypothetical protein